MSHRFGRHALPTCLGILALALLGCGREPPPAPRPAAAAAVEPPVASVEPRTLTLVAGAETEAELAGGERHTYRLELAAGQFADLIVDQRGIDVVVSLTTADGDRRLTTVDSPNDDRGAEPLPLVAESAAPLLLVVGSGNARDRPGRYALIVGVLRPATARDRDRVAAERAFALAEALRRREDENSLRAAVAGYEQVLESFRALGDRGRQADVLDRLGRSYRKLAEADKALEVFAQALSIFRRQGRRFEEGSVLNHLGGVHRSFLGDPQTAIRHYREALAIHRSLSRRSAEATSLCNLGRAHDSLGELDDALTFYEQALEIQEELDERAGAGLTLNNMGLLYIKLGKPQRAREILERALSLNEAERQIRQAATSLIHLGRVCGETDQLQETVTYLGRALEKLQQLGARHEETLALNNLGWAYDRLGRPEQARTAIENALTIFRELGDRHGEAAALASLGMLRSKAGEHDAAVGLLRQALVLLAAGGDRDGEARVLYGLAYTDRRRGDPAAAQEAIERALERIEALRSEPASPGLRSFFLASKQDYYRFYVDLLMDRHQRHPAAGFDARALEASERARARSLLDLMAEAGAELRRGVDPVLVAREQELGKRMDAAEKRRRWLQENEAAPERLAAAEGELRQLLAENDRLQAEIRRAGPLSLGVPARLEEIQELLDERTLLVEYTLGAERSFVWVLTPESVRSFELAAGPVIEDAARGAYAVLANSHRRLVRRQADPVLDELSRLLLDPVAEHLGVRRLLIIPDGALHYIPFAALPIPSPPVAAGGSPTPRPLVAEHEVVTLPSASTLAELRRARDQRRRPAATLAVVANPVFDAADPRVRRPAGTPEAGGKSTAEPLRPLPFSGDEAKAILDLVPAAERLAALDFAAGRAILGKLGDYRLLHFATHGFFDSEHPELSWIALSMVDEEGRPQDGTLRAHEIYRLDLAADLVVLSACHTALGPEVRGEGLIGLTRPFMVAGARRVVVSLWQVEDRATAELMKRFYRRMLVDGRSPAAALRQAQLALRRQEGWEAPYYWAGFVLHGDW
ncbi:MAG: CHAT domain-containing protein [bacterium]|nr:CHAT domain-containing protein [bacterium]